MKNHTAFLAILLAVVPTAVSQTDEPGDALRGPTVSQRTKRTLVHHSMTGEFQRVIGRPEEAAVEALELDEDARRRAAALVEQRSVDVALLLVQEIDRVVEISDAVQAGESELAQERLRELWAHFEPERPRDPLAGPLGEVLDEAQRGELQRLLDEYWDAWVAWEMRGMEETDAAARALVTDRLSFELFRGEVAEGYEATLRRYRDSMEIIYNAVDPTDEQRAEIRRLYIDHIRETQLGGTPDDRRQTVLAVYHMLDDARKERLFEYLLQVVVPDGQP